MHDLKLYLILSIQGGHILAYESSYPKIGLKHPNASTVSLLCFLPLKMTKTPKNSGFIVVASFLCNLSGRGSKT